MQKLFNTLGRHKETFRPVRKGTVTIFTCGPSVYQRSHIGNFRTFLFEDVLVRYLEYAGYNVCRGMNYTDVEDKALDEAAKRKITVRQLTESNIKEFIREMKLLKMKLPDYLPKASESVSSAVEIIRQLLARGIAYWYRGNVYFDPLKFPGFGKLYGLDMSAWPKKKIRFHKDTYPGIQWNLGDFILWHGCKGKETLCWDTGIGKGRPSWNIQDPSMISRYFQETLSIYCGGIDNLYRHHDYSLAVLESIRPYPMARYWLHCHHLYVDGKKMSKSSGNIIYTDTVRSKGYTLTELRFFLTYSHYRETLNYSEDTMRSAAALLRAFKKQVRKIGQKAGSKSDTQAQTVQGIKKAFSQAMDNDLNVKAAFDGICKIISGIKPEGLCPGEAAGIISSIKEVDKVFRVIL